MKLGILPIARSTFDVPFAEERLAAMLAALDTAGGKLCGPRYLLLEPDAADAAMDDVLAAAPDLILVLQVTFTDAGFIARLAGATNLPIAIWAPPEPRLGGRLRLNALWRTEPGEPRAGPPGPAVLVSLRRTRTCRRLRLRRFSRGGRRVVPRDGAAAGAAPLDEPLAPMRIARIGTHPEGFDTCRYDHGDLIRRTRVEVDELELATLFDAARALPEADVAPIRTRTEAQLPNLGDLDAGEVDRSLRLAGALQGLRATGGYDGFAIRCWPETFTQYGGAVCGPVSMMGEARAPCACEADVHGAATLVLLQRLSGEAVFLVDLVDLDTGDDSAVVWHCGQAPVSMADPETRMRGTVHTNRRQALLYEFPLKPGRVTFFRLSQAFNSPKVVVAGGEMLRRPPAFTGTSGVVRFDRQAGAVLKDIMDTGMEHHMALAYGDHRGKLASLAAALDLPLVELGSA